MNGATMKVLKKFEHKAKARSGGFASKYDWDAILSGQNVQLDAGTDYPTDVPGWSKEMWTWLCAARL